MDHMVCEMSGGSPQCKCREGFSLDTDGGCSRTGKAINTVKDIHQLFFCNCIQCLRKYWTSRKK